MSDKNLHEHAGAIQATIKKLAGEHQAFAEHAAERVADLERASYPGLNFPALRNALCGHVQADDVDWVTDGIYLVGCGPWDHDEFAAFLASRGFDLLDELRGGCLVVFGAHGWSNEDLEPVTRLVSDGGATLFTQEMFVAGLIRNADPVTFLEDDSITEICDQHEPVQFFTNEFPWPVWPASESDEDERDLDDYENYEWADESALKRLGYNAQQDGPSAEQRRAILQRAFSLNLDEVADPENVSRWGEPNTARRLVALASFLNWLVRFQGAGKPDAAEKWQSDAKWLRQTFYKPTMGFAWPEVKTDGRRKPARRRTPNAAFMKPLRVSPMLAAVIGSDPLPRTEVVSRLWAYIKKHKLQDPVNKRMVNADAKLRVIFGKDQVSMFEMAGLIGKHVK